MFADDFGLPKPKKIKNFRSKQISFSELENDEIPKQNKKPSKYANKNY